TIFLDPRSRPSELKQPKDNERGLGAMNPIQQAIHLETRRQFLAKGARGFGALALASLFGDTARADGPSTAVGGQPGLPHFAPKATRAVYLHMVGAPP